MSIHVVKVELIRHFDRGGLDCVSYKMLVEVSYKLNLDYVNAHYHQLKSHAVAMSLYYINEILK